MIETFKPEQFTTMININKKVTIILGIIIAGIATISNPSIAATSEIETSDAEQYALVESLVTDMTDIDVQENSSENVFKVYNRDNHLVYESRNREDQKLIQLMKKSDLLTNVNQIYYYKLSR